MLEFRTLLTVATFAGGGALIVLGVLRWRVTRGSGKIRSGRLITLYGVLFILAGAILWARDPGRYRSNAPLTEREIPHSSRVDESSEPLKPAPHSSPMLSDETRGIRSPDDRLTDRIAELPRKKTAKISQVESKKSRRDVDRENLETVREQTADSLPPEDRIYSTISRAFDSIEMWFFANGHTAPAVYGSEPQRAGKDGGKIRRAIRFPKIAFESGTAELHPQSREDLKGLAASLKQLHSPVSLEIQARVDSIGPEPFNYILTQARVEIVRDVLIQEGVDTRRLLAIALGSQGEDSIKAGTQIRFVLRP